MTSNGKAAQIIEALDEALHGPLHVNRVDRLEEFVAPGEYARYLREPHLTVAQHFDIQPASVIFDPLLGTLGIVDVVLPKTEVPARTARRRAESARRERLLDSMNEGEGVAQSVRKCIDRATYLRHLLLRDRDVRDRTWRSLTVELVLLTADETEAEKRAFLVIGQALRDVLRETESLFHIGVGVLRYPWSTDQGEGRLRRAFPWLLRATDRWLSSPRAKPQEAPGGHARRLRRLILTNYRLPGLRDVRLSDTQVHLVHGPNGSGKSSIVEALEIVTCGKVARLERAGEKRYDDVIKNSNSTGPATVLIGRTVDGRNETVLDTARTIVPRGLEEPLDEGVDASSFRLDQSLMERLINDSQHERAKTFLRAFFPEAMPSDVAYEQAAETHKQARVKVDGVIARLTSARKALMELKDWRSGGRSGESTKTAEEFPVVLNSWLEQTALVDLLQRERGLRSTIQEARRAGWEPSDRMSTQMLDRLGGATDMARLEEFEREGISAVNELQAKLASFRPSLAADTPRDGVASDISQPSVQALNVVTPFLYTEDEIHTFGRLGDKLAAVINGGDAPTYPRTLIGGEKWAEPILSELEALIAACNALDVDDVVPPNWPGKQPCVEYQDAERTHAMKLEAGKELTARFIDKLRPDEGATGEFDGSLIAALNELMALFTPARWAYEDIRLPAQLGRERLGLPLHLGGPASTIRAELHLNTAELNLFTVALFLLCIGRVRKPLNLVVFDDPLQNMDELTSTALARGLAKLVRLRTNLGLTEELLLLFHGYGDLDRFSSEIAAATYRLPWLSPSAAEPPPVKAEGPSGEVTDVQTLGGGWLQDSR